MSTCAICLQRQLLRLSRGSNSRALHTSAKATAWESPSWLHQPDKPTGEPVASPSFIGPSIASTLPTDPAASGSQKNPVVRVSKTSLFNSKTWRKPREPKAVKKRGPAKSNEESAGHVHFGAQTSPKAGAQVVDSQLESEQELDYDARPEFEVPEDWAFANTEAEAGSRGDPSASAQNVNRKMVQFHRDRHNLRGEFVDDSEDLRTHDVTKSLSEVQSVGVPRKNVRRRDRRTEVSNLAPIPADDYPFDPDTKTAGMVRYNWKSRALSRLEHEEGRRWYLSLPDKRVFPENRILDTEDKFFRPYSEYSNHFRRLLDLEQEEERRIFFERLKKWSDEMLRMDGQALFGMSATPAKFQPSGKCAVEFSLLKKSGEAAKLPYHRFEPWTDALLSRTHPLKDPAQSIDPNRRSSKPGGNIKGKVTRVYRDLIVVEFNDTIEGLQSGRWRLDIGISDYVWNVQKKAIAMLELSPVAQDAPATTRTRPADADVMEHDEVDYHSLENDSAFYSDFAEETMAQNTDQRQETILQGTALRHILLRAFQENFKPYHSVAGLLPVASKHAEQTGAVQPATEDSSLGLDNPSNETSNPEEASIISLSHSAPSFLRSRTISAPDSSLSLDPTEAISLDTNESIHEAQRTHVVPQTDSIVPPTSDLKPTDVDAVAVPNTAPADVSHLLYMDQHIHSWAVRHMVDGDPVRCEGDPEIPLNPSQIRAIAMMLYNRLSLVQGPPGTGKTRVIIETIKLLKQHWQIPHPILVTAHTNVAVDNLLAGLVAKDTKAGHGVKPIKALRVGNTAKVPHTLMSHTYEAFEHLHPLYGEIDKIGLEIEKLYFVTPDGKRMLKDSADKPYATELRRKRNDLMAEMRRDILADHDVICTTCIAAGSPVVLKHTDFPFVFLDEASMATEPLSLVPLMKGSSQVAIIGDHKQLPPVIKSEEARFGGLDTSLFERLIHERNNVPRVMLDTQYRMHPAIAAFPSQTFYNGDLKNGTINTDGTPWSRLAPAESTYLRDVNGHLRNVMFINHEHEQSADHESLANFRDAEIVVQVVTDLLAQNPDVRGKDIGIIAPYAAQIRLLRSQLRTDIKSMSRIIKQIGTERAGEVGDIEIKTVDGFEGREKEVIVFSTVRSNPGGWIGFLADWRRLNVGITRAKRALVIVGDARTLENARIGTKAEDHLPSGGTDVWRKFIQHLREQGQIMDYNALVSETRSEEEGSVEEPAVAFG